MLIWRKQADRPSEPMARHETADSLMIACGTFQRAIGDHSKPGCGPAGSVNRPVRTRMPGGVGAGG